MKRITLLITLLMAMPAMIQGQRIVGLNIPTSVCAGDTIPVTFGYNDTNNVILEMPQATLARSERIFLPDGKPCGTMGCSYISAVNFDIFDPQASIVSVNDIQYVRLNIEHSFLGDLFIRITCPDGHSATLLNFGGYANTDCASTIPQNALQWASGYNQTGAYLGIPVDFSSTLHPCDSTDPDNAPGIGWNYCWSNNTEAGYTYAPGDGLIYRAANVTNNTIDSSNIASGTQFYHPDQSFSSLIGCPLNGDWSIEVLDGYGQDNGYIFEWSLSLDPSLIPTPCEIESCYIIGNGISQLSPRNYSIAIPQDLERDTMFSYTFTVVTACGDTLDTTATIHLHLNYDTTVRHETIENLLPFVYNNTSFHNDTSDCVFSLLSQYRCDSTVHFNLDVWRNSQYAYDTAICPKMLPYTWHNQTFTHADTVVVTHTDIHGADSVETLTLSVIDIDTIAVYGTICNGVPYLWKDGVYYSDTSAKPLYIVTNENGCDSVWQLHLAIPVEAFTAAMTMNPNPASQTNPTVTLTDVSQSVRREWDFLDRNDTSRQCSFNYPSREDSVAITLIAYDRMGCMDSITRMLYCDKATLWVPNVFTPDEQTNNIFTIATNDIIEGTVVIYNRQGLLVSSFDLLDGSWDGTSHGKPCPQEAYVWKAVYTTHAKPGIQQQSKGTVLLLR